MAIFFISQATSALGRSYRPDGSWADKQRPGADIESDIKDKNVI